MSMNIQMWMVCDNRSPLFYHIALLGLDPNKCTFHGYQDSFMMLKD